MTDAPTDTPARARLGELAALFLRLGATTFGGPAVHMALMEHEVVHRRRWLSRERFLDMIGACNLIPGPNSTELAIHIGHDQRGWAGLVVAGACFIAPAMAIVMAIGWLYVRYGTLPAAEALLYGVKPVMIAIGAQALWKLGRTAVRSRQLAVIGAAAIAATALGVHELIVLAAAGVLAAGGKRLLTAVPLLPTLAAAPFTLGGLFLFFLKTGAVLYGSGYVLIAFLRGDLVDRWHWLTEPQLLDAIAVGQVTPGPIFTTATFVGYQLGGPIAALVATAGIFLPAFVFVAISGPLVPRLRRSPVAGAVLDGVNVASLALMAVVFVQLGATAIVDAPTAVIAAASSVILVRWPFNPTWFVLVAGVVGIVLRG